MATTQYISDDVDQLIKDAQKQDGDVDAMEFPSRSEVIQRALQEYIDGGDSGDAKAQREGEDK